MFDWRPRDERGRSQPDAAGRIAQLPQMGSMTIAAQKLNQMEAVHMRSLAMSVAPKATPARPRPGNTRLHRIHSSMYPRVSFIERCSNVVDLQNCQRSLESFKDDALHNSVLDLMANPVSLPW